MVFWIVLLIALALLWLVGARWLGGADLRMLDALPADAAWEQHFSIGPASNAQHQAVLAGLQSVHAGLQKSPRGQRLGVLRRYMDALADGKALGARFVPVDAGGVPAEWVLAPGADGERRTLYIHGGAWMMGSARSHRTITSIFSAITGGAVLAINYRLLPEFRRIDGIVDCRRAYEWLLDHGPDGARPVQTLYVAGDSAGGNLTLALLCWVKAQGLRQPDAAVALSPATDATLSSPSLYGNVATDPLLGPLFAWMTRLPRSLLLWLALLQNRMRPADPQLSPLRASLAGLPPLLLQVGSGEMLRDDSVRFARKARAAGSPVRLQTWDHVVHVWHIFHPDLDEAAQAFDEIGRFLAQHPSRVGA